MKRTVKSFVLRAGRVSQRQKSAFQFFLPNYQLPLAPWNIPALFGEEASIIVEIGFGMGDSLIEMAKMNPDHHYIGIEVHQAGIGSLVAKLHEQEINNVHIAPYDAVSVFEQAIPENSLAGVQLFFPDPWPKKRHHKRRLVQEGFVQLITEKLRPQGFFHLATDWEPYAEQMLSVCSANAVLVNQAGEQAFSPRPSTRPMTKFEQRGEKLGHAIYDLHFIHMPIVKSRAC